MKSTLWITHKFDGLRAMYFYSFFFSFVAGTALENDDVLLLQHKSSCSNVSETSEMDCGGARMCGILALQMGTGDGVYESIIPQVHGLWPSVPPWGNAPCVTPTVSFADLPTLASCYQPEGNETTQEQSWFEDHEWEKHGVCAGVKDAADYFNQVCNLSTRPLQIMQEVRSAGGSLVDAADQLQDLGICVRSLGPHEQIYLSACAGPDGRWKLADIHSFASVCGTSAIV